MNQRRQNNSRGGGQQQQISQQNNGGQVTDQNAAKALFNDILKGVEGMKGAIEAVLPRNQSFGHFRSILMMALRHNPDIMTCSVTSIITSCMKAAYDGVNLDGKEAALVPSMNKVKDPISGREFSRRDARYSIMIAGMRKQLIAGGIVRDFQSTVVYANDQFHYERGLNPKLEHVPVLDADKRGDMVGAYSVAWFKDGGMPSFEVMNRKQIEDVREMSQSGPVWKGKVADEMWRKVVSRRHRKALPGGNDIPDMEARDDFPQFVTGDVGTQHLDRELPAKQQSADAPRRGDFAFLEGGGADNGTPLDFGRSGEMSAEEIEREERGDDRTEQKQTMRGGNGNYVVADDAAGYRDGGEAEQDQADDRDDGRDQDPPAERVIGPVPDEFETWDAWAASVVTRMKTAATLPKLDAVTRDTKALFDEAPDAVQQLLGDVYAEKAQDHREAMK